MSEDVRNPGYRLVSLCFSRRRERILVRRLFPTFRRLRTRFERRTVDFATFDKVKPAWARSVPMSEDVRNPGYRLVSLCFSRRRERILVRRLFPTFRRLRTRFERRTVDFATFDKVKPAWARSVPMSEDVRNPGYRLVSLCFSRRRERILVRRLFPTFRRLRTRFERRTVDFATFDKVKPAWARSVPMSEDVRNPGYRLVSLCFSRRRERILVRRLFPTFRRLRTRFERRTVDFATFDKVKPAWARSVPMSEDVRNPGYRLVSLCFSRRRERILVRRLFPTFRRLRTRFERRTVDFATFDKVKPAWARSVPMSEDVRNPGYRLVSLCFSRRRERILVRRLFPTFRRLRTRFERRTVDFATFDKVKPAWARSVPMSEDVRNPGYRLVSLCFSRRRERILVRRLFPTFRRLRTRFERRTVDFATFDKVKPAWARSVPMSEDVRNPGYRLVSLCFSRRRERILVRRLFPTFRRLRTRFERRTVDFATFDKVKPAWARSVPMSEDVRNPGYRLVSLCFSRRRERILVRRLLGFFMLFAPTANELLVRRLFPTFRRLRTRLAPNGGFAHLTWWDQYPMSEDVRNPGYRLVSLCFSRRRERILVRRLFPTFRRLRTRFERRTVDYATFDALRADGARRIANDRARVSSVIRR